MSLFCRLTAKVARRKNQNKFRVFISFGALISVFNPFVSNAAWYNSSWG
ncbi:MAG: hypothetical protein M3Q81_04575 [bacterium]|nr:hypothetical protein [bacterium]